MLRVSSYGFQACLAKDRLRAMVLGKEMRYNVTGAVWSDFMLFFLLLTTYY